MSTSRLTRQLTQALDNQELHFSREWTEKPLVDLALITMGQSPSSMFYNIHGEGLPLIQGNADLENRKTIERVWTTQGSKRCDSGDLILTVRAPVGAAAVASKDACIGRGVCSLKPFGDSSFLFHALVYAEDRWQSLEQGSTFTAANSKQVGRFQLRIPNNENEQRAIAEVLSDMDGLLNSLEALIAKKRAVKQAVMQQLLTGRARLPGFSGTWETKRLGDLGNCHRGVSYDPTTDLSSYDQDSTVRLLRSNNIQEAVVILTDVQHVEARKVSEFQVMRPDDILVCMANGSKELVGKAGLFRVKDGYTYTFGAFMGCFRVEPTIAEPNFVFYIFHTHDFRNFINLILAGSSINNLKPSDIESATFLVPDREEQNAIASVLSDIDGEITALEQRQNKTRAIKQGMMQHLLTGRVRLVKYGTE